MEIIWHVWPWLIEVQSASHQQKQTYLTRVVNSATSGHEVTSSNLTGGEIFLKPTGYHVALNPLLILLWCWYNWDRRVSKCHREKNLWMLILVSEIRHITIFTCPRHVTVLRASIWFTRIFSTHLQHRWAIQDHWSSGLDYLENTVAGVVPHDNGYLKMSPWTSL